MTVEQTNILFGVEQTPLKRRTDICTYKQNRNSGGNRLSLLSPIRSSTDPQAHSGDGNET